MQFFNDNCVLFGGLKAALSASPVGQDHVLFCENRHNNHPPNDILLYTKLEDEFGNTERSQLMVASAERKLKYAAYHTGFPDGPRGSIWYLNSVYADLFRWDSMNPIAEQKKVETLCTVLRHGTRRERLVSSLYMG